jgi:hypothetical protein
MLGSVNFDEEALKGAAQYFLSLGAKLSMKSSV